MNHRPNISKHLQNQAKKAESFSAALYNKPKQKESIMDSPMFAMAKAASQNLKPKMKLAIASVVYLLVAGIVGTIIGIIKLILLFI